VRDLAARADLVLVVGSTTSSNSNRLRELAEKQGKPAYLIDGADDIRREWLSDRPRVGLTAGASAPQLRVEQVIQRLRDWGAGEVEEQTGLRENVTFALPKELQRPADGAS
jgi:4-hydroxy-3-methylbut-2-enyl diphosphate reductase